MTRPDPLTCRLLCSCTWPVSAPAQPRSTSELPELQKDAVPKNTACELQKGCKEREACSNKTRKGDEPLNSDDGKILCCMMATRSDCCLTVRRVVGVCELCIYRALSCLRVWRSWSGGLECSVICRGACRGWVRLRSDRVECAWPGWSIQSVLEGTETWGDGAESSGG